MTLYCLFVVVLVCLVASRKRKVGLLLTTASVFICAFATLTPTSAVAAPFTLRVNFRPAVYQGIPGNEYWIAGHQQDKGLPFATQSGFTFGWVGSPAPVMVMRGTGLTTDPRASVNAAEQPYIEQAAHRYLSQANLTSGKWEAQVPNGQYSVRVVCGDAEQFGAYSISVEGRATVSGTTTSANSWLDQTVSVRVSDGRLTLSSPTGVGRLNFVHIKQERTNVKFDFRPTAAPSVPGYLSDDSSAYAPRDTGYTYGWAVGDTTAAFIRTPNAVVSGSPFDTPENNTVVVAGNRKWEMEVPDGLYRVRVIAGDASGANLGEYRCEAEDISFPNVTLSGASAAGHFFDNTVTVPVTDGRLTLRVPLDAPVGTKLHLCRVEISDDIPVATEKPVPGWISNQPIIGAGGSGSSAGPSAANSVNLASGVYENLPGADIVVRNPVGPDVSFTRSYTTQAARRKSAVSPGNGSGGFTDTDEDDSGDFLGLPSPPQPSYSRSTLR